MGTRGNAFEMLGAAKAGLQDVVMSKIDEEVNIKRWNNIEYAALAMVESHVEENQVLQMLMKYWDLRPSEAKKVYEFAVKKLSRDENLKG